MATPEAIRDAVKEYYGDSFEESNVYEPRLYIFSRKEAGSQFLSYHGCKYLIRNEHFVALKAKYRRDTTACVGLSPKSDDPSAPLCADTLKWYCCFDIDDVGMNLGYELVKIAANVSPARLMSDSLNATGGRKFRRMSRTASTTPKHANMPLHRRTLGGCSCTTPSGNTPW